MNDFRRILSAIVRVLGSFTLASVLFIVLFVLTFFGTLEQAHSSLHDVQKKYFESPFFVTEYGVPLPGAHLVLTILFVNLVVGGMVRMRRTWSRVGIFIIHIGIALLLLSGLIESIFKKDGMMQIWEGASAAEFVSFYDWDVSVFEELPGGRERVYTIPTENLPEPGETSTFRASGLPFEVRLSGYLRNCEPRVSPRGSDSTDGVVLMARPPAMEAEQNLPGITATLVTKDLRREAVLWAFEQAPYVTTIDGRNWAVSLHKRTFSVPFSVALRRFTHEMHPGTSMASSYSSDVTRIENNVAQDIHISMNQPMRYRGYTFYQTNWGPQNDPSATRFYSVFEVVSNPADRGPLIALIVIATGLLVHMGLKLFNYVSAEGRRRA